MSDAAKDTPELTSRDGTSKSALPGTSPNSWKAYPECVSCKTASRVHGCSSNVPSRSVPRASAVPALFLDGVKSQIQLFDLILDPEHLEGVEVYVGAGVPGKYNDPCGVILIWTRLP